MKQGLGKIIGCLRGRDGVALIAVIFLLIVIGALGIAISNVMQNQASQTGLTLNNNCSDYAAYGGARFGSQQITDGSTTVAYPLSPSTTPLYTMPNAASFSGNGCSQFVLSCKDNSCSTVNGTVP
jgi:Tfp pilus assembly protein PilX